ncbi:MAG: sulfite exporter TauE/SafE family protein [Candidatus Caldarchaeum sp.]
MLQAQRFKMEYVPVLLAAFVIGIASAVVGAVIGAGGGFIFVPITTMLLDLPPRTIIPASLSLVFTNSLAATWIRFSKGSFSFNKLLPLSLLLIPGVITGSITVSGFSAPMFKLAFGIFLITISTFMAVVERNTSGKGDGEKLLTTMVIVGISGLVSSLFGVGGGLLMVPSFATVAGMNIRKAVYSSQFFTMFSSLFSLFAFGLQGHFDVFLSTASALGGLTGSTLEAAFSIKASSRQLKTVVITAFTSIGFWMIISTMTGFT